MNKIKHGQFFTTKSPFVHPAFLNWWNNIDGDYCVVEPFAGSNNIIKMLNELNVEFISKSFDIEPKAPDVFQQNTIENFPKGYNIAITNPPYLGYSTRRRLKIDMDFENHQNLYLLCLEKCLENCNYVAAIIPETFITLNTTLKKRLCCVISIIDNIFDDTAVPVCLALWNKNIAKTFDIYSGKTYLGTNLNLLQFIPNPFINENVLFNDINGQIGLIAIDNSECNSIKFCKGNEINNIIKDNSRFITKLSFEKYYFSELELEILINKSNEILEEFRSKTSDVFLTAFKNIRKDNKYRRRLDYRQAKKILLCALEQTLYYKNSIFRY